MTTTEAATPSSTIARVIPNMAFADYVKIPALNWSTLKEMRRSPLHYAYRAAVPLADNAMFTGGRAVHAAVLEPDRFPLDFAVFNGPRRAGKEWVAFRDANAGRTILRADEYAHCLAVRDAVRRSPIAMRYLALGRAEQSVVWLDKKSGLPAKARVDWICDDMPVFVDLKTTNDLDMRRFGSVAARLGYHCQIAWYLRGLVEAGVPVMGARIIAVEQEAPFDVGVFSIDEDTLFAGSDELDELVARVAACMREGSWSGRYAAEEPLQLPSWWYAAAEESDLGLVIRGGD